MICSAKLRQASRLLTGKPRQEGISSASIKMPPTEHSSGCSPCDGFYLPPDVAAAASCFS